MRTTKLIALLLAVRTLCLAQLTPAQKAADFRYLASIYEKNYAPYEWKKQLFGFDLANLDPWLERVARSKDDVEYFEICVDYTSSLRDSGAFLNFPSIFEAYLDISADVYDGKLLIRGVDRRALPASQYPFAAGDEIVSVDGKPAAQLLDQFSKYVPAGSPRMKLRGAAFLMFSRPQAIIPSAAAVGREATLAVVGRDGIEQIYALPWRKSGVPLSVGPVPSPKGAGVVRSAIFPPRNADDAPSSDSRMPAFALPDGFVRRLGQRPGDLFVSGSYKAGDRTIGFIRISAYGGNTVLALQQFDQEIAWFRQNTDGLVLDAMSNGGDPRNPPASLCYGEELAARFAAVPYRIPGHEIRATQAWVNYYYSRLSTERARGAEQWEINLWQSHLRDVETANREPRGRTGPLPLCAPSLIRQPAPAVYTKPMVVLIDELSSDFFPAILQDNSMGILFGTPTMGSGGLSVLTLGPGPVPAFPAGAYTEITAAATTTLMTRAAPVVTSEYPTSYYIENIGVRPHVFNDFMTRENLLEAGRPFVRAFTASLVEAIP